jgi:hypothetical protein
MHLQTKPYWLQIRICPRMIAHRNIWAGVSATHLSKLVAFYCGRAARVSVCATLQLAH